MTCTNTSTSAANVLASLSAARGGPQREVAVVQAHPPHGNACDGWRNRNPGDVRQYRRVARSTPVRATAHRDAEHERDRGSAGSTPGSRARTTRSPTRRPRHQFPTLRSSARSRDPPHVGIDATRPKHTPNSTDRGLGPLPGRQLPRARCSQPASLWVTGASPIHTRNVFLSLVCWMKMSCSGGSAGSAVWGDLK